jgi:DNA-binding MarR family transcriptional regulator
MRSTETTTAGRTDPFPKDASGCLYDPRAREVIRRIGEGDNLARFEAVSALRLATKRLHAAMERFADGHHLSEGRLSLMFRLLVAPDHRLPLGELADTLNVAPRTITGLIDNLERDGWVARVDDPQDRRSTFAQLTPGGLQKIGQLRRRASEHQMATTVGLTDDQLLQLRDLCLRIVQNLDASEGGEHAG